MDLKSPGNRLYLVGATRDELGASHFLLLTGRNGGVVPQVDTGIAPRLFGALHEAISAGHVRACHDCSEGGLAVAAAEMAFSGGFGADLNVGSLAGLSDEVRLFSESPTRWLAEVPQASADAFEAFFRDLPLFALGSVVKEKRLRIAGAGGEWLVWAPLDELKAAWQTPLGL
jgi:phosphoribosylformylglycinamidine synthase